MRFERRLGRARARLWSLVFGLILAFPLVMLVAYVLSELGFHF